LTAPGPRGTVRHSGNWDMLGRNCILGALLAVASVLAFAPAAGAASWLEENFWLSGPRYSGKLPPCDYPRALSKIQYLFGLKERRFWNSRLSIASFEQVREIAFRPWAPDTIPRRFCAGLAMVSDGVERPVYYSIAEDTGLIGASWGVEWCVVGLDRNWAFNPACKMAKP
jgi:hypothetical protein